MSIIYGCGILEKLVKQHDPKYRAPPEILAIKLRDPPRDSNTSGPKPNENKGRDRERGGFARTQLWNVIPRVAKIEFFRMKTYFCKTSFFKDFFLQV